MFKNAVSIMRQELLLVIVMLLLMMHTSGRALYNFYLSNGTDAYYLAYFVYTTVIVASYFLFVAFRATNMPYCRIKKTLPNDVTIERFSKGFLYIITSDKPSKLKSIFDSHHFEWDPDSGGAKVRIELFDLTALLESIGYVILNTKDDLSRELKYRLPERPKSFEARFYNGGCDFTVLISSKDKLLNLLKCFDVAVVNINESTRTDKKDASRQQHIASIEISTKLTPSQLMMLFRKYGYELEEGPYQKWTFALS